MKICPKCGMSSEDEKKFCANCGSPLTEVPAAPAEEPVPEAPAAPVTPVTPEETIEAESVPAAEEKAAPAGPEEKPEKKPKEKPEKEPKKPREKKKVGAGRRILAVLLCILLFVFLLTPALGYAVRRATTEEGLAAVMDDLDISEIKVAPYFDDVDDEELKLTEMLTEDLNGIGLKFGESSVTKVLNSNALKLYLAEQLSQVFRDVYRGKTSFEFDPERLRSELLEGKTSRVLEREKMTLTEEEADKVVKLLEDYGLGDTLSRDTIKDEAPEALRAMNLGLSYVTIIGLLVLAAGCWLLICKVNRWNMGLSFGDIGGTALAVGLVLTLGAGLAGILPRLWQKICGGQELIAAAGGGVLIHNIVISLIVLGAGLVLAIVGRLLRRSKPEEPDEEEE